MDSALLGLVLLIEFLLLVSIASPLWFAGRFSKRPNLGILTWLILFKLSLLAGIAAVVIAVGFVFESYFDLQAGDDLGQTLLISFAPWLLLAFGGVLLAITNLRLAPYFESRSKSLDLDELSVSTDQVFEGAPVQELRVPGFFAIAKDGRIYLSTDALALERPLVEAVLWHELGHIRLGHQQLRALARFANTLLPWFLVSSVFNHELHRLGELAADKYALKHVERDVLLSARRLFL